MREKLEYFLRLFCPGRLYNYSTKVRVPQNTIDFRKFLVAKLALKNGGSAIDGGAHIGYYTRYFAEIIGERGRVYSFEPNPYVFPLLAKYTKFHRNILSYQKALSCAAGKSAFFVEPFSLSQDSTFGKSRIKQKKRGIEKISLDECLLSDEKVRLIKLDIEGHEMQAIRGAERLIGRCRPWIICEYVQNEVRSDHEIVSLLEGWGYFCLDLETLGPIDRDARINLTDIVAVPEDELEREKFVQSLSIF